MKIEWEQDYSSNEFSVTKNWGTNPEFSCTKVLQNDTKEASSYNECR